MKKIYPYSQDKPFLEKISSLINQEQWVRIVLLDFKTETPIMNIEGEIASGTLNKDGSSAVRCTCSLSCAIDAFTYNTDDIKSKYSIGKKIFLEFGITNDTDDYPEEKIIWFPQGTFFISSFSINSSSSGSTTINLQFKDKMATLDGTVGGVLPATTRFDLVTDYVNGAVVSKKVLVYDIIMEAVNHFGGEDITNIVIDNVPTKAKRIIRWMGTEPVWIFKIQGDEKESYDICFDSDIDEKSSAYEGKGTKYVQNQDIGFMYEDFVYDDELTFAAGSKVTDVLDKIKNWLGNYEYFYDENGIFHFQEIKNYLNTGQASYEWEIIQNLTDENYLYDSSEGMTLYTFTDNTNLTSITNTPLYENIKNDYIVEGKTSNNEVVRYHLVIDDKPEINTEGFSNILIYKDPITNNYTVGKPIICTPTQEDEQSPWVWSLPDTASDGTIYGLLDEPQLFSFKKKMKKMSEFSKYYNNIALKEQNLKQRETKKTFKLSEANSLIDILENYLYLTVNEDVSIGDSQCLIYEAEITALAKRLWREQKSFSLVQNTKSLEDYIVLVYPKKISKDEIDLTIKAQYYNDYTTEVENFSSNVYDFKSSVLDFFNLLIEEIRKNNAITYQQKRLERLCIMFSLVERLYMESDPAIYQETFGNSEKDKKDFWNLIESKIDKNYWSNVKGNYWPTTKNLFESCNDSDGDGIFSTFEKTSWINDEISEITTTKNEINILSNTYAKIISSHTSQRSIEEKLLKKTTSSIKETISSIEKIENQTEEAKREIENLKQKVVNFENTLEDTVLDDIQELLNNIQELFDNTQEQSQLELLISEYNTLCDSYSRYKYYTNMIDSRNENIVLYNEIKDKLNERLTVLSAILTALKNPDPEAGICYVEVDTIAPAYVTSFWYFDASSGTNHSYGWNELEWKNYYHTKEEVTVDDEGVDCGYYHNGLGGETYIDFNNIDFWDDVDYTIEDIKEIKANYGIDIKNDAITIRNVAFKFSDSTAMLSGDSVNRVTDGQEYSEILSFNFGGNDVWQLSDVFPSMNSNSRWYQYYYRDYAEKNNLPYFKSNEITTYVPKDWRVELILEGLEANEKGTETGAYFSELIANWPNVYDFKNNCLIPSSTTDIDYYIDTTAILECDTGSGFVQNADADGTVTGNIVSEEGAKIDDDINTIIINGTINNYDTTNYCYFFDIIDSSSSRWGEYCVDNIGRRTNVTISDSVNCIFAPETPNYAFINVTGMTADERGQKFTELQGISENIIQVTDNFYNNFATGGLKQSAYDQIKYDLQMYTTYQNTVSVTARPCFYLEPNVRVRLQDESTGTAGNYTIKTISIPLGIGNNMSVSLSKTLERM